MMTNAPKTTVEAYPSPLLDAQQKPDTINATIRADETPAQGAAWRNLWQWLLAPAPPPTSPDDGQGEAAR